MQYVLTKRDGIGGVIIGKEWLFEIEGIKKHPITFNNGTQGMIAVSEASDTRSLPSIPGFRDTVQWVPFCVFKEHAESLNCSV
jgi:hypothetical protein